MAIKTQPGQIPQNPGVYFFKDNRGKILYIGKAANLKARLASYLREIRFPDGSRTSLKLNSLLKEAVKLDWKILNSEVEALIKEAELIKKYRPKYNVLMRDDKNYFYVGFTKEKYPKIFLTHQPGENAGYIGPFTEGGSLRTVLKTLRRTFPYCTCKSPHKKPCLNAKIGRCLGFCCLQDQRKLTQPFDSFSPAQRRAPRVAGPFRSDQESDTMPKSPQNPPKDSLVFSSSPLLTKERGWGEVYDKNITSIKKILSGKNQKLARELKIEMQKLAKAQKYEEAGKVRDQIWALDKIFEHRVVIKQDLPSENLKAISALEAILGAKDINRIEAYDIANIGGKFAYGSMAVFENGKINKEEYRIFKIKTVHQSDDPAMLREVLTRRLRHLEWTLPQVIIIDGGKPQISASLQVQKTAFKNRLALPRNKSELNSAARVHTYDFSLPFSEPKLIALTKNKKHVGDHIFIGGEKNPIVLAGLPPPLKNLILNLDSEAHRFAISYYRKLHRKSLSPNQ